MAPVEGGASNITWRARLGEAPFAAVALRLQRDTGILAPYDVVREGEVLRRLQGSGIPVPAFVDVEPGAGVLGAPFLVMEWIEAPHMGIAGTQVTFASYVQKVAAIHALDWRALGLGFLGVPATAAAGTLAGLDRIEARMAAFGCADDRLLARALATLRATVPPGGELSFCQGDINVFNYLVRNGEVVAVVDWEMARIGDLRNDIGQIAALGHLKAGTPFVDASELPFVRAYEAVSGRQLPHMNYFRARWLFELGVIYHGWLKHNDFEPWYSWEHLSELLGAALPGLP
ncbi:phosphotransferase family protein [bacterium]|nr:MAG: phosphotransferase family protein [bacterium]